MSCEIFLSLRAVYSLRNFVSSYILYPEAENSKIEIQKIEEDVKQKLQKVSKEKDLIHEYSSIEADLKEMKIKLEVLEKRDEDINILGITPVNILQEISRKILNIREYKHLPGLSGFDFQTFDEKLTESEGANYNQRIANVRYLKRIISTQISIIKEERSLLR